MVQRGTQCGCRAWSPVFPARADTKQDYIDTDIYKWLQPNNPLDCG
jgi:hypothetical protein